MSSLSPDFNAYVAHLTRRSRLSVTILITATALTAGLVVFHYVAEIYGLPPLISLQALLSGEGRLPKAMTAMFQNDPLDPLQLATISANVAVAAALRTWYNRQEKMTALLTHALVLEGESETAIRVLLNREI